MTDTSIPTAIRHRRIRRSLDDLLEELAGESDPAFTIEQVDFIEKRFYEIREVLTDQQPADIDLWVHQLLAKDQKIAAIWCVEDVQGVRPHLTVEQAWEVLEEVGRKHDAEWGITYTTLETVADNLYPEPDESGQADRGRP